MKKIVKENDIEKSRRFSIDSITLCITLISCFFVGTFITVKIDHSILYELGKLLEGFAIVSCIPVVLISLVLGIRAFIIRKNILSFIALIIPISIILYIIYIFPSLLHSF